MRLQGATSIAPLRFLFALAAVLLLTTANADQTTDSLFVPHIARPAYPRGAGPVVLIDESHNNFHTMYDRYQPFAHLLEADGYVVKPLRASLQRSSLESARVLVIANALAARNRTDWSLPIPSAFTTAEIEALRSWIEQGGSLLLIVDHMPFPGAANELASALGIRFSNGFVFGPGDPNAPRLFRSKDGTLAPHPITHGRTRQERISQVATFTGSAFTATRGGLEPLLVFPPGTLSLEPRTAWQFGADTPRRNVGGWFQGAVFQLGRGRAAVFAEAGMFTAQRVGPMRQMAGMNSPEAKQNAQFTSNVLRWLCGTIDEPNAGRDRRGQ